MVSTLPCVIIVVFRLQDPHLSDHGLICESFEQVLTRMAVFKIIYLMIHQIYPSFLASIARNMELG